MLKLARKEVIAMPTETLMSNERKSSQQLVVTPAAVEETELRKWARQHVERVHRLKLHLAAYVFGMIILTPIWALAEWGANGSFERFSANSQPGDWEPWILWPALIWGMWVGFVALRTYWDKPTTEAEIDREIDRLQARG
jgi:hypothetical protein